MKLVGIIGLLVLVMAFSCTDKQEKKEDTKVEVTVEKDADTKIKIGPDGGSVKTKKVEVEVKNDNE